MVKAPHQSRCSYNILPYILLSTLALALWCCHLARLASSLAWLIGNNSAVKLLLPWLSLLWIPVLIIQIQSLFCVYSLFKKILNINIKLTCWNLKKLKLTVLVDTLTSLLLETADHQNDLFWFILSIKYWTFTKSYIFSVAN